MKDLKGLDEWITRDNRQEIPERKVIYYIDGYEEKIGSFTDLEDAHIWLAIHGTPEMKAYPNDYIYESEVE